MDYKNKYYKYKNKYYKLMEQKKIMKGGSNITTIFAVIMSVLAIVGFFAAGYYNKDKISGWFDKNYKLLVQRQETSKQNELAERAKQRQIQIDEEAQKEGIKAQRESFLREQGAFGRILPKRTDDVQELVNNFNIE